MVICTVPACYQAVPEHQGQDVLRWAGGCSPGKQPPSPAGCSRWGGQHKSCTGSASAPPPSAGHPLLPLNTPIFGYFSRNCHSPSSEEGCKGLLPRSSERKVEDRRGRWGQGGEPGPRRGWGCDVPTCAVSWQQLFPCRC